MLVGIHFKCPEKGLLKKRLEKREGISHADIWDKSFTVKHKLSEKQSLD